VVASGRVETPHRVDLGVQITGTVLRVPVVEGQSVTAGQTLIELEAAELRAALAQADLAVAQAQARLRQLREVQAPVAEQALRQAQANHEAARQSLLRNRDLLAQGFIGRAALDEAERAEQVAQAQVRSAQQQLSSARPRGSDSAVAEAALAQAQAGADAARARWGYATLSAPLAGTLITRDVEPGDVVQPGKVLMVLSPAGEVQLVVQIDEKNLRLLRLGQPAIASADAYAQQRFAAVLVYINPGVDAQRGSVEVKLRVPEPPAYLKQDMTVSVDIEVARRAGAVLVPSDALHDADSNAPWVLKLDGHRARRSPVRLGLRSSGLAEVLDGLQAGDRVIPVGIASAGVADGARVRPLAAATVP
jgi:HlyD family secretion protein